MENPSFKAIDRKKRERAKNTEKQAKRVLATQEIDKEMFRLLKHSNANLGVKKLKSTTFYFEVIKDYQ